MEFMREGGFGMWLTLAVFLGGVGLAYARRAQGGERIALGGAIAVLASGLLGMSTGIYATVTYLGGVAAAEHSEVLAIGIRESVNNTLFAAALAFVLAIVGVVLGPRARAAVAG